LQYYYESYRQDFNQTTQMQRSQDRAYKKANKSKREKANATLPLRKIGVERVDLWYRASKDK